MARDEVQAGNPAGTALHPLDTQWMDSARIIAVGAVVLIHVIAPIVSGAQGVEFAQPRWWLGNMMDSACRAAVPIFIMLSGALLLSPERKGSPREFYSRRLARIGLPLIFWSLAYLGYRKFALQQDLDLWSAAQNFALGHPYFHLYFLFILFGLYAVTPLMRIILDALTKRASAILCLSLMSLGVVDQLLSSLFAAGHLNAMTHFLPYLGYYLAGHILRHAELPRGSTRSAGLLFTASTAMTAGGTWFLAHEHGWSRQASYFYDYLSPTVIVASLAAFVLLRSTPEHFAFLKRPPVASRVQFLSSLTFGIYLIHPLLMALATETVVLPTRAPALLLAVSTYWLAVIASSLCLVAAARSIPLLRRVL